jgi:hypothetical protein
LLLKILLTLGLIVAGLLSHSKNGETSVRWSVNGHNSFFFRIMGIFISMDKMVGGEFEKGLVKLKKLVESEK